MLVATATGAFVSSLNNNIVNVALPQMATDYGVNPAQIQWVVTTYFLTTAVTMVIVGRLSDIVGRKRIYTRGCLIFAAGAALAGLGPSLWICVMARVVQAIGGSMLVANALAIVAAVYPPEKRGQAVGVNGTLVGVGSFLGPSLGGLLTDTLGWHYIFLVNVPFSFLLFAFSLLFIPTDKPDDKGTEPFDLAGTVFYALAMLAIMVGTTNLAENYRSAPFWLGPLVIGAGLLALFIRQETGHPQPVLDLRLFRNLRFSTGLTSGLCAFMVAAFSNFSLPFYLEHTLGLPPASAGLVMTPFPLAMMAFSWVSGYLADRTGTGSGITTLGMALITAAMFWLSFLTPETTPESVMWRLLLLGLGMGFFNSPNNSEVMNATPPGQLGLGSSLLATSRHVGQMLGTSLAALFLGLALDASATLSAPAGAAIAQGVRLSYLAGGMIGAAGALLCFWRLVTHRRERDSHAPREEWQGLTARQLARQRNYAGHRLSQPLSAAAPSLSRSLKPGLRLPRRPASDRPKG